MRKRYKELPKCPWFTEMPVENTETLFENTEILIITSWNEVYMMPYIYIVHVYQYQIMIEFYLTITVVVFFLHQLFLHFKFYNIPFIGNYISNGLFYPIWAIGPTWLTQLPYHLSSVLLAVSNSAHSSSSPSKDVKLLYIFYVWKF